MVSNDRDLGSYFLELARQGSPSWRSDMDVDDDEEAPAELNTIDCSGGFLVMSTDKLSVQYAGVDMHGHDVGAVQANRPAPVKRLAYYFEMTVRNAGAKGHIAIGFTTEGFKMRRQPGWEVNSYGYHGDDGLLYRGQGKGDAFGPTFTTGDTVGGGINYASQEFFFTKNGVLVGTTHKDMNCPFFPTVAVHSQNEEVTVNFGMDPFVFNLKEFEAQERRKQQLSMIEKLSIPQNISYGIVRSYLLHYGYEATLNSFDEASRCVEPPVNAAPENGFNMGGYKYALSHRNILRQLIKEGKIDETFSKLREWYPQLLQDEKSATCLLHCQKFIELVRAGELEEAVKYGRMDLAKYFGLKEFEELVQDCVALLAYEQPQKSLVGYLLEDAQREVAADMVNAMILSTNPDFKGSPAFVQSCLEKLLRQLTVCWLERRALDGDQGEAFHLTEY